MRPLSILEIDATIESLGIYLGRRLQSIEVSGQDVALGFWEGRRVLWLWLDLSPNAPLLMPLVDLPANLPAKRTPLRLFLQAHFVGAELTKIERIEELGRVVRMRFDVGDLELRLIPRDANLIASAAEKRVALRPIRELTVQEGELSLALARPLREILTEWKAARFQSKSQKSPKTGLEKKLENLRRSLDKVSKEIENKTQSPWRKLGEWLLANQSLDVPAEFAALIDRRRKLAWNIEQCFQKAKENERKLVGTKARARELEAECTRMRQRLESGDWLEGSQAKPAVTGVQSARTLHLRENFHVAVGKSARDNLDLLRQAHAWDIWLHIKDRPGAHAVLFRPKGSKMSDELLREAGQWLLRMSFGPKFKSHDGEKFEILTAECRYVSPIKGDRLGRVTYRNEKVLRLKFDAG